MTPTFCTAASRNAAMKLCRNAYQRQLVLFGGEWLSHRGRRLAAKLEAAGFWVRRLDTRTEIAAPGERSPCGTQVAAPVTE